MNIDIVNFEEKYVNEIDELENKYWGKWESYSIKDEYKKYDLFLIALVNNKYAGHIYGIYVGDLFYFDVIIVKDGYRNKSIATKIIEKTIEILKHNNFKTIVTTVENLNNSENHLIPLLEKYNFEKITNVKGYWGSLYPEVLCNECNSKPCKCVATIYLKKI